jgi:hypothetical protein
MPGEPADGTLRLDALTLPRETAFVARAIELDCPPSVD